MKNILFIDDGIDTKALMEIMCEGLYNATVVEDITQAILILNIQNFDLIVLDGNLPDGCGTELALKLQTSELLRNIPIIMLTANHELEFRIKAFNNGVDQFMTKPYNYLELLARIGSELVKLERQKNNSSLKIGNLVIDTHLQNVLVDSETVELTSGEFKILMVLAKNIGTTMNREDISDKVWGMLDQTSIRQVDAKISTLRKKIGADKIESVHGVGYRLVA